MASSCFQVELEDWSNRQISYQFINMQKDATKRETMQRQFSTAGMKVDRIEAIVGKEKTREQMLELVQNGIVAKEVIENKTLSPGQIGIYLSYLEKALVNAENVADGQIIVTFEDDIAISPTLESKLRAALKKVPSDWDILYLGCNQGTYFDIHSTDGFDPYFPKRSLEDRHYVLPTCPVKDYQKVTGTPWVQLDSNCIAGGWAVGLNSASARKLKKALTPIREPLDIAIKELVGKSEFRAYCLNPELVSVDLASSSTKPDGEWK